MHILKNHGPNGRKDHSLADLNDAARIAFVLDNYDSVEPTTYASGEMDLSAEFRNRDNTPAPMLKYSKKVDGTYYVVEAVPDSNYRKFWVVSAYMTADSGTQAPDVQSPGTTSETSLPSSLSADNSIPQSAQNINSTSVESAVAKTGIFASIQPEAAKSLPDGESYSTNPEKNDDFGRNSRYYKVEDSDINEYNALYHYINGVEAAGKYIGKILRPDDIKKIAQLTDRERAIYNYYWNTNENKNIALDYLRSLNSELTQRVQNAQLAENTPEPGSPEITEKTPEQQGLDTEYPKLAIDQTTEDTSLAGKQQTEHPIGTYGYGEGLNVKEAVKVFVDITGISEDEARRIIPSVYEYTGADYKNIRAYQEYGTPDRSEATASIEEFIAKSPKWNGGTIYRGINISYEELGEILGKINNNKVIDMKGVSSWSTNWGTAEMFSKRGKGEVRVVFVSTGEQNGTSIRYLSQYPKQSEVICSMNARWVIEKIRRTKKILMVYCKPVK